MNKKLEDKLLQQASWDDAKKSLRKRYSQTLEDGSIDPKVILPADEFVDDLSKKYSTVHQT